VELLPIILAGGSGTRLWPASRATYPKQLLTLAGEHSLLQATAARLDDLFRDGGERQLLVVANAEYRFTIREQLRAIDPGSLQLILEPVGRNTAPALTLAALVADSASDPVLLVMPADHLIRDTAAFHEAVAKGAALASDGTMVTFGIVPSSPETGYGYIHAGDPVQAKVSSSAAGAAGDDRAIARRMLGFAEKPDTKTAEGYLASGDYLWNSGIFMMRRSVWLAAIETFAPKIVAACRDAVAGARLDGDFVWVDTESFTASPVDSIDYAVMERLAEAPEIAPGAVVPLDAGWSDVGSWDALWAVSEKDPYGNVARGDVVLEDCRDSLVYADERLVTAVGCHNMIVVESADAVMVTPMDKAQEVKDVVAHLVDERPEVTQTHRRSTSSSTDASRSLPGGGRQ